MANTFNCVHCLFEQSGTYRDVFRSLGFKSFDYDICDDFHTTDYLIDLFCEINKAYNGEQSIFDYFRSDDLVIAFFPCVRFSPQSLLLSRCDNYQFRNWDLRKKIDYSMNVVHQIDYLFSILNKLVLVCINLNLKLVIENPYNEQSFLIRYWCIKPTIIDYDRREHGDYYCKPTMYYFIGLVPSNNFNFDLICRYSDNNICDSYGIKRSLMSVEYAKWFIKEYLL